MDAKVSEVLLRLNRGSRRMQHDAFRPWAFKQLSDIVAFDSAFWYRWAIEARHSPLHASYLYLQPQRLLDEYFAGELWNDDVVYLRALASPPGTAIYETRLNYASERMKDFMLRHQQEHLLTIAYWDVISMVAAGISLYRNASSCPFDAQEARLVEVVAPHFIDAWRENWLMDVIRQSSSRADLPEFSLGVMVNGGLLSEAQDNFGAMMRDEWPAWQGPRPPNDLLDHFAKQTTPWIGTSVAIYRRVLADGTVLLLVRRVHPLDQLAPRKRSVAVMVAHGASQSEIARRLSLSPSTVNNYLTDVYEHLEVHDRVMLANLVMSLEP